MSTHDVPGHDPDNLDELKMGCWAEHEDGSLIFVNSTEGGRVVYHMFDTSTEPTTEYRDAMTEEQFKDFFSYDGGSDEEWTWHDKTPFDWNRVIKRGAARQVHYTSADDQLSAARRVADSLKLRAKKVRKEQASDRAPSQKAEGETVASGIFAKLGRALDKFIER